MTGTELFEALSFVDEKYIQEAETARFRKIPWMKYLTVAACLCVLILGAFALENLGLKGATEEAAAPAEPMAQLPAEAQSAREEAAPLMPEDGAAEEATAEETAATDERRHIPYATLRIVSVADDHWIAVVEEIPQEPVEIEVGMQVKVIIDANEVPTADENEARFGGILLPEEGLLAKIENGAYDAGANILYITGAILKNAAE